MPPPVNTPLDYATQFQRLLPRGRIWHRGLGMVEDADILVLMPTWARLQDALNTLIAEINPCTTDQLLPEWMATLGIPDACMCDLADIDAEKAAVCAKFKSLVDGGQSMAFFVALAASIGVDITITELAPFRVDINTVEQPLYDESWAFAWQVSSQFDPATEIDFTVNISVAGDPLRSWGNKVLECLIREFAPAHTIPIFVYWTESIWDSPGFYSIWDGGASIWDDGTSLWDASPGVSLWDTPPGDSRWDIPPA